MHGGGSEELKPTVGDEDNMLQQGRSERMLAVALSSQPLPTAEPAGCLPVLRMPQVHLRSPTGLADTNRVILHRKCRCPRTAAKQHLAGGCRGLAGMPAPAYILRSSISHFPPNKLTAKMSISYFKNMIYTSIVPVRCYGLRYC
jgi:hypothetical protein